MEIIKTKGTMKYVILFICGALLVASSCAQSKDDDLVQTCDVATTNRGDKILIGVEVFITGKRVPVGGLSPGKTATSLMVPIKGEGKTIVRVVYQLQSNPGKDIEVNIDLVIPKKLPSKLEVSIDHSKSPKCHSGQEEICCISNLIKCYVRRATSTGWRSKSPALEQGRKPS